MLYPNTSAPSPAPGPASVITPQISAAGVEHLDTLFRAYINVEPGRGHDAIEIRRRSAIRVISTA